MIETLKECIRFVVGVFVLSVAIGGFMVVVLGGIMLPFYLVTLAAGLFL